MSAIFKTRKTPKHLILTSLPAPGRRRFSLLWQLLGVGVLLISTLGLLYLQQA